MNQLSKKATRRERQKRETRRLVLETAFELFEEKGYDKTTMRELAARAGVALGTIFVHFPDKAALLVAAFEEDLGKAVDRGLATLPEGKGLKAQLLHLAEGFFAFYAKRPALSQVLVRQSLFLEGPSGSALNALALDFIDQVGELFRQAQDRGEIRSDVDPSQAALAFWADYFLCVVTGLRTPGLGVRTQVLLLNSFLDQRFDGLRPRAGGKRQGT